MTMHARTANPLVIFSLLVVMLVSGLTGCGATASTAPASGSAAALQHVSGPDEGNRALQRVSHAPTSECDDGSRIAARMGITVTCRSDQGAHIPVQPTLSR